MTAARARPGQASPAPAGGDAWRSRGTLEVLLHLLPERFFGRLLAVLDQGADRLAKLVERDGADGSLALGLRVAVDPVGDPVLVVRLEREELLAGDLVHLLRGGGRGPGDHEAAERDAECRRGGDPLLHWDFLLEMPDVAAQPRRRRVTCRGLRPLRDHTGRTAILWPPRARRSITARCRDLVPHRAGPTGEKRWPPSARLAAAWRTTRKWSAGPRGSTRPTSSRRSSPCSSPSRCSPRSRRPRRSCSPSRSPRRSSQASGASIPAASGSARPSASA